MDNDLIEQKGWWNRNWKWVLPVFVVISISTIVFFSSDMDSVTTDLVQAYADTELYNDALEKVKNDQRAKALLGDIEPIDKMAIFEGYVKYSNENKTVYSSVRIVGTKGKAKMDISADRINNEWSYNEIKIRIKNPPEKKQELKIYSGEQNGG